jgi:erythromycin esterase
MFRGVRSLYWLFFLMLSCVRQSSKSAKQPEHTIPASYIAYHKLDTEKDLDQLINDIGKARIVLLGEASHGTAEYYNWRAAITKKLFLEKGFNVVAVEGDWTDIYTINQFIQGPVQDSSTAISMLGGIKRWPLWLWANKEIVSLVLWMNKQKNKPGFFGLDLFSMAESAKQIEHLSGDHSLANLAVQFRHCLDSYDGDALKYAGRNNIDNNCSAAAEALWQEIKKRKENKFLITQNARVIYNGEAYFRIMAKDHVNSWNIRERHMMETIDALLKEYGRGGKIIIWAHNTHVGDAQYAQMMQGRTSLDVLLRSKYSPGRIYTVGFGSYTGNVTASRHWGDMAEAMPLPPAIKNSLEERLHNEGADNKLILCRPLRNNTSLIEWVPQRAVGVVYQPEKDHQVYVPSIFPYRYDAFIFLDHTEALHPVEVSKGGREE